MTDSFGKVDGEEPGAATSPFADMMEVTRLTSLGRLEEASALIQRSLVGNPLARTLGLLSEPHITAPPPIVPPPTFPATAARDEVHPVPGQAGPVREVVGQVVRGLAPVLKGLGVPLRTPSPRTTPSSGGFVDRTFSGPTGRARLQAVHPR